MSMIEGTPIKRFAAGLFVLAGALALPSSSIGQDEPEPTAASAIEESDMVFVAGEELRVTQKTTDDLFAAANTLEVNGAQADHLFLAGGDLKITQTQVSDIVAAGGDIRLEAAAVADDVIIAGGEIVADEDFDIGGTAVIVGGDVRFEAPVGQDLRIGANDIFVNSVVPGTARLSGDTIVLGPKARIGGDLLYRGSSLTVDSAAVIEGDRTQLEASEPFAAEEIGKGAGLMFLYFGLSTLFSYFVIVAMLVLIVPRLMQSTSQMLERKPLQALGIGVLFAVIAPVLGLVLIQTGLGLPLAVFLFVASLALTPIAVAVSAHFLGMFTRKLITRKSRDPESTFERIVWPLAGVVILLGLCLVPLVGLLVLLFAMLFGLGAFGRQVIEMLSTGPQVPAGAPAMA
ncbi:MAG: hypothetical protein WBA51_16720 [Erythrobacter sp.]